MAEPGKKEKANKKKQKKQSKKPSTSPSGSDPNPQQPQAKESKPSQEPSALPSGSGTKSQQPQAKGPKPSQEPSPSPSVWGTKSQQPQAKGPMPSQEPSPWPSVWGTKSQQPQAKGPMPSQEPSPLPSVWGTKSQQPQAKGPKPSQEPSPAPSVWGTKSQQPQAKGPMPSQEPSPLPSVWGTKSQQPQAKGPMPSQEPSPWPSVWDTKSQKPRAKGEKRSQGAAPLPTSSSSSEIETGSLTSSMSSASLSDTTTSSHQVPARNTLQGKKYGQELIVQTNFFPLKLQKLVTACQYDVVIQPEKPFSLLRPVWNEFVRRKFPGRSPSFDGRSIAVSAEPLFIGTVSVSDSFSLNLENDKRRDYTIVLTYVKSVDLGNIKRFLESKNINMPIPAAELAIIDIALRNRASNMFIRSGRSFFPIMNGHSLGGAVNVYTGYYQAAVLGWQLYLNFDISHKCFPCTDMIQTIEELCTDRRGNVEKVTAKRFLNEEEISKLETYLKGLKVEYMIPGNPSTKRVYRVNGVRPCSACDEIFEINIGNTGRKETINVVQYFKNHKNYIVKYPKLPCLWVGSTNNKIYVPAELCTVVAGQLVKTQLTDNQRMIMVKESSDRPLERKRKILNQFNFANFGNEYSNEFGISVSGEMEKITARILPAPYLQTKGVDGQRKEEPRRGQFDIKQFQETKPLLRWCVVNMNRSNRDTVNTFKKVIRDEARRKGMDMGDPICGDSWFDCDSYREKNVIDTFTDLKKKNVQLAFVFIPDSGDTYSMVKRISEIQIGVLTQCIKRNTLWKAMGPKGINISTFSNILLKVNAKLNGVNHSLHPDVVPPCLQGYVMVVGADVTHPSPGVRNMNSVAAVTGSYDQNAVQYHSVVLLQEATVEIIKDFEYAMRTLLEYFCRQRRRFPEKILIFRDGVSEGQVDHVLSIELKALRNACVSIRSDYRPLITYMVVQKRHHTRFFPQSQQQSDSNVPPGTCVDTKIVHPRDLDFYLVSHFSPLGTARPTKYKLIYNENTINEHQLEVLSYYLCYLVVRCTKAISYPAPTYYAHLMALRGKAYLPSRFVDITDTNKIKELTTVRDCLNDTPMYFV